MHPKKTRPKPNSDDVAAATQAAVRFLAAREHSVLELRQKLKRKGFAQGCIESVLHDLQQKDWLNEKRYVDAYIRYRAEQGVGPLRIKAELWAKGVRETNLEQLNPEQDRWYRQIQALWEKRFARQEVKDNKDLLQRWRYLQQKGYTDSQIESVVKKPWTS